MNAREALQRAIAAAEQAEGASNRPGWFEQRSTLALAQLAQAWAAIAQQLRVDEDGGDQ